MNNEILAAMIREQGLEELVADMHPDGVLLATGIILSALDTMREAQRAMRPEGVTFKEIGSLHRTRDGEIHFIPKEEKMEFPLHSFIAIYGKYESPAPQEGDAK